MSVRQRRSCCICHEIRPKTVTMPRNLVEARRWYMLMGETMPQDYTEKVYYICDLHFAPGALEMHLKGNRRSNDLAPLPLMKWKIGQGEEDGKDEKWSQVMERKRTGEDPTTISSPTDLPYQQFNLSKKISSLPAPSHIQLNSRPSMRTSFSELINHNIEAALRQNFQQFHGIKHEIGVENAKSILDLGAKLALYKELDAGKIENGTVFAFNPYQHLSSQRKYRKSKQIVKVEEKQTPEMLKTRTGALTLPKIILKRPAPMDLKDWKKKGDEKDEEKRIVEEIASSSSSSQFQPKTLRDIVTHPKYYHHAISKYNSNLSKQRKGMRERVKPTMLNSYGQKRRELFSDSSDGEEKEGDKEKEANDLVLQAYKC